MIRKSPTLFWYIGRQYFLNFIGFLITLLSITYIFETVELSRRLGKTGPIDIGLLVKMGLLKLPEVGQELFPFAVLFSAIFTFWRLTRSHELVVVRSAGISAWQFMLPILTTALLVSIIKVGLINPASSILLRQYERLETRFIGQKTVSAIDLSGTGLWLKQNTENGPAILHAPQVKTPEWLLNNVIVFFYDQNQELTHRLDSAFASLENGAWVFKNPVINRVGFTYPETLDEMRLETDLTIEEIESRFSSPETVSFWQLPEYIRVLESTGFSANTLKIHYFSLLSDPILYFSLILLAAALALRPPRQSNNWQLIVGSIGIAFFVFFMGDVLQAFGISDLLPITIAAFAPALISLMIGLGAIFYLEDG